MIWKLKFIDDLVGKPWELNGTGAPGFDCYSLVRFLYARVGVDCPLWLYDTDNWKEKVTTDFLREAKKRALRVKDPKAGDFVIVGNKHCGVMIDSFVMINSDIKRGVFTVKINRLKEKLVFWRPNKWAVLDKY